MDRPESFRGMAQYYDTIYSFKDHAREADKVVSVVDERLRSGGKRLLDVACGTGEHLRHLAERFEVEGVDISDEMLAVAREKLPGTVLTQADMVDFDLGRRFDIVVSLFSSIGYSKTVQRLGRAVDCMSRHLVPGGVLVVEPWFTPDAWKPDTVHADIFGDTPELRIARVNTSFRDGNVSWFDLHHLVGTPQGTTHFVERHELGLFTQDEMRAAFEAVGLETDFDPDGLTGRGLWVGQK